jgi:hypothetical protein
MNGPQSRNQSYPATERATVAAARYPFGCAISIKFTISEISQSRVSNPAAIAGEAFTAELIRAKLYQTV